MLVFRVKKKGAASGREGATEKMATGLSGFWRVIKGSTLGGGPHTVLWWRERDWLKV